MFLPNMKSFGALSVDLPIHKGMVTARPCMKGELSLTENLSSRLYPYLSTRLPRGIKRRGEKLLSLCQGDGLCCLTEGALEYGGREYSLPMELYGRELLPFGGDVLILPQGGGSGACGIFRRGAEEVELWNKPINLSGPVEILWCTREGEILQRIHPSTQAPEDRSLLWLDLREEKPCVRLWSVIEEGWAVTEDAFLMLRSEGIGEKLEKGLCFSLDNATDPWLYRDGNCKTVLASGEDYVIFEGVMRVERVDEVALQLRLFPTLPKLDHWILHGNRLWGCRYGEDVNGKFVNCIYASKLGRPDLWYALDGLSSDSYFVNVGEPGAFTGVGVVGDCPVFFKENCLIRVSGNRPGNFRTKTIPCSGVRQGCEGTVVNMDGSLLYLGRDGLCLYDGSEPLLLGQQVELGELRNVVAGAFGKFYYLSCGESFGELNLLVYDLEHGLWHGETGPSVKKFCSVGGELYFYGEDDVLYSVSPCGCREREKNFSWKLESAILSVLQQEGNCLQSLNLSFATDKWENPGQISQLWVEQQDPLGSALYMGQVHGKVQEAVSLPLQNPHPGYPQVLKLYGMGELAFRNIAVSYHKEGS